MFNNAKVINCSFDEFKQILSDFFEGKENSSLFNKRKSIANNDGTFECKYSGYSAENIYDKNNNSIGVRLFFATPGLTKDDLTLTLTDNIIRVVGKKKVYAIGELDTKVRIKFPVLEKNVRSKYANGLLTIEIFREKKEIKKENIIPID